MADFKKRRATMSKLVLVTFLVSLAVITSQGLPKQQRLEYNEEAEVDAEGNIYVSSEPGKLIWMGNTKRCSELREATDRQTFGCRVMQDPKLGNTMPSLQLEIYRKGGHKVIIEPGAPIGDWHFWNDGEQVAVSFGPADAPATYALYESATARVIEKLSQPSDERQLPQWAKSEGQIQAESVPVSAELAEERMRWIGKVLREIGQIRPGMKRKDLLTVFTTEGGLSTRTQRTYVYKDCPYIKVTVHFKALEDEGSALGEDPDDIIESLSPPFLAGITVD
jgi:hypothetical protein